MCRQVDLLQQHYRDSLRARSSAVPRHLVGNLDAVERICKDHGITCATLQHTLSTSCMLCLHPVLIHPVCLHLLSDNCMYIQMNLY